VRNPEKIRTFLEKLEKSLPSVAPNEESIDKKWSDLRDAIYDSALATYGRKERKNADWYEAHWEEMEPATAAKRKALLAYKMSPNPGTLNALRLARKHAQQLARQCANTFWLNLCNSIQSAADTGNTRGLFDGIKKAIGPPKSKPALLKSKSGEIITDREKQLQRWVEHYLDL
jgi:uncharacterized protein YbdZ (MbtH family)